MPDRGKRGYPRLISDLIRRYIHRAKLLLREGKLSITQIAMNPGFCSSQHLATVFKKVTAMTLRAYRRRLPACPLVFDGSITAQAK